MGTLDVAGLSWEDVKHLSPNAGHGRIVAEELGLNP